MSLRNDIIAEIHLDSLRYNLRQIIPAVAPAGVIAVVKANAYGHGAVPVSRVMVDEGIQILVVAVVDEAIELREAGIDVPIFILDKVWDNQVPSLFEYNLQPPVASDDDYRRLSAAALEHQKQLDIHFKVDTGMGRSGFIYNQFEAVLKQVIADPWLRISGIMSHLATADELVSPLVKLQHERFDEVRRKISHLMNHNPVKFHLANSAGALYYRDMKYDYVRLGLSLYGIPPVRDREIGIDLKQVMAFKTKVAYEKRLPENFPIGYGSTYHTRDDSRIAVCSGGYEDGIPRRYGNSGHVIIHGRKFPIAGNVSMDTFMVDVRTEKISVGDEVTILGQQGDEWISAWDMAEVLGVIPYEVLCGISPRVVRTYIDL